MGIQISLEDESGAVIASIEDPMNILHRVLPGPEDRRFPCLSKVDWYGDTIFNRRQIGDVLSEISRIAKSTTDPSDRELLGRIAELALECESQPHLYLKFYGD